MSLATGDGGAAAAAREQLLAQVFSEVHAALKLDAQTAAAAELLFHQIVELDIQHVNSLIEGDASNHIRQCIATAIFVASVDAELRSEEAADAEAAAAFAASGGAPAAAAAADNGSGGSGTGKSCRRRPVGNGLKLEQLLFLTDPPWVIADFLQYVDVLLPKLVLPPPAASAAAAAAAASDGAAAAAGESASSSSSSPSASSSSSSSFKRMSGVTGRFSEDFRNLKALHEKFERTWDTATAPLAAKLRPKRAGAKAAAWMLFLLAKEDVGRRLRSNDLVDAYAVLTLCTDWILTTSTSLSAAAASSPTFSSASSSSSSSSSSASASSASSLLSSASSSPSSDRESRCVPWGPEFRHDHSTGAADPASSSSSSPPGAVAALDRLVRIFAKLGVPFERDVLAKIDTCFRQFLDEAVASQLPQSVRVPGAKSYHVLHDVARLQRK